MIWSNPPTLGINGEYIHHLLSIYLGIIINHPRPPSPHLLDEALHPLWYRTTKICLRDAGQNHPCQCPAGWVDVDMEDGVGQLPRHGDGIAMNGPYKKRTGRRKNKSFARPPKYSTWRLQPHIFHAPWSATLPHTKRVLWVISHLLFLQDKTQSFRDILKDKESFCAHISHFSYILFIFPIDIAIEVE